MPAAMPSSTAKPPATAHFRTPLPTRCATCPVIGAGRTATRILCGLSRLSRRDVRSRCCARCSLTPLRSLRDFIRWGASEFNRHGLHFGHGTDNALDEAFHLVLSTLKLPFDLPAVYLESQLAEDERAAVPRRAQGARRNPQAGAVPDRHRLVLRPAVRDRRAGADSALADRRDDPEPVPAVAAARSADHPRPLLRLRLHRHRRRVCLPERHRRPRRDRRRRARRDGPQHRSPPRQGSRAARWSATCSRRWPASATT